MAGLGRESSNFPTPRDARVDFQQQSLEPPASTSQNLSLDRPFGFAALGCPRRLERVCSPAVPELSLQPLREAPTSVPQQTLAC